MNRLVHKLRAAGVAAAALIAVIVAAPAPAESAQRHGWSGHRAHHHRAWARPVHAHRPTYARRHVGHRHVVVRHRHVHRPIYRTRVVRAGFAPPFYVHAGWRPPRRCFIQQRWVHTYYGPQLIRQRVCHRR